MANVSNVPSREFPTEDSLCESCGYPLKGLNIIAHCPECGYSVWESSPAIRDFISDQSEPKGPPFLRIAWRFLTSPKDAFRRLAVGRHGFVAESYLINVIMIASLIFTAPLFIASMLGLLNRSSWVVQPAAAYMAVIVFVCLAIVSMILIETMGVTAVSKRRAWRVPFSLAHQVCCYASIGWLPGMMIAGLGTVLIEYSLAGQFWFESMLGLVRVRWLVYAGLFVLSFLWFETLVWIGVRQVRFANTWPDNEPRAAPQPSPEPDR